MKYIRSSIQDKRGFAEYVRRLDDDLYNYGLAATGTSPSDLTVTPIIAELEGVQIDINVELDSDGEDYRYYFMPVITLPVLDSTKLDYADSIHYYLEQYAKNLGKFAKYLIGHPFIEDMYDDYFDELDEDY